MRVLALRLGAALLAIGLAGAVLAQDPQTIAVQSAARTWLAFIDRGDAQGAWNSGGKKFQSALTPELWATELGKQQRQDGKPVERTVGPTRFQNKIPGMPDGQYAQILFRTRFANKPDGTEQLTLEREPDGQWRVIGYFPGG
ncbi:MAG: DUF4019 domain-containing protein [Acidobacteriota bacterium]